MADRVDAQKPWEVTDDGDLEAATGGPRLRQRILRGLSTSPGEPLHRPGWGAGLKHYQGKPATRAHKQEVANRIQQFLKPLEAVDAYEVTVTDGDAGEITFSVRVEHDSGTFEIGSVSLGST